MSRESRQRLGKEAERQETRSVRRRKFFRAIPFIGVGLVAVNAFAWIYFRPQIAGPIVAVQSPSFKQPETFKQLLGLSPAELERCDIARMNLLCAEGLPGAENLNVEEDLAALDQWAQHIQSETARNFHH